ncbi:hypothetical protein LB579_34170, partial [Mesorhizobium sp. BR1-1-7]|uniref:hypothetical protein n=1 Tax=Mesorhizobium sp. BR1-1-7 TaxID=2876647 RepID=UPI001CC99D7D
MPEDIAGFEPSKADPAHQAVSPQAARTRLQFLDTKGLVAPHRFLYLDECLDRFGSKRLGSVWDEIVGLRCFPFQYVSRKRAFYRYRVSRKRPYDRVDRRIVVRGPQRKEFRSASREYKKLLKELSKAIQAEAFKVLLIAPDGQITPIEHLSVFAAQVVRAFYTGTVRITKNDTKHKRWILVDEKSFARWLENGDGPRHRTFGRAIFKPLLPAIAERAALKGYTLVEEPFWDLLD